MVALVEVFGQLTIQNHFFSDQQCPCGDVHAAYVAVKQVFGVNRLAAYFGIKIHAACGEASPLQDGVHRQRGVGNAVGKLVGVPLALHVATVHVD